METETYIDTVDRIGFSIPDHNGSGIQFEGLLSLTDTGLKMEYAPKATSHSGFHNSGQAFKKWANKHLGFEFDTDADGIKTIELAFAKLDFLKRRNFFFFSTILLSSDSMRTFSSIPNQKQGRLTIYIAMRQSNLAARFVSNCNMKLADWRMNHADELLDKVRRFEA